ncbi:hypothetical protein BDV23DRAFT_160768 [Aspergillus alliaceus]|uniref:Uncharacterized protein n=1 Tax=Petromyces alliaceus TaxID=209559 RepID=A0A5N7C0M3_PETAA|nr:hypothetical protein BDV23DRAFT_160768 [Aspergillus alliaceus]
MMIALFSCDRLSSPLMAIHLYCFFLTMWLLHSSLESCHFSHSIYHYPPKSKRFPSLPHHRVFREG